ncbi:MAG: class I SAM-dependent methyltransferase [Alphaproteobacteria bacterium]|nr:class I SAM-dependent methyltransferase [Alphaproteobacteria bacterium]
MAKGSPDRFGYSWDSFNDLTADQEEQFRRWTVHLDPARDWQGKLFLDVGCGAGRNSYWPMTYGAAGGRSIDVDERSLAAARRNLSAYPTVEVAFCSAYDIAETDVYDIVFSIGVIHHLDDPALALRRMVQAAKPGGRVLIWVYGYENMAFYVNVLNPLRKALFSRMPLGFLRLLAHVPTGVLWSLLRLGFTPIEYFRLLRNFSYRHLHHILFDQMLPKIAHYWRRDQVERLMTDAGLHDVKLSWVNEMSWSAVGVKPE